MSNILIIKHGSLGDIAQASGAIQDISENHKNDRIYLLTTKAYLEVFKKNPFIHEVILDKRLPRYNLIYLYFLMRELKKHSFSKVFDLQNSSRTNFYKNILFPKAKKETWSSSITTLSEVINKNPGIRSHFNSLVYLVEIQKENNSSKYFDEYNKFLITKDIPNNLIKNHKRYIHLLNEETELLKKTSLDMA